MKIAVLICGDYREFDYSYQFWNFVNQIDCDIYMSTWNKSIQINEHLGINLHEDISEDRVKKNNPNIICSILNEYDYFDLNKNSPDDNSNKMIFHWKNCLKLLKNSGNEYDLILLTRPDIIPKNENIKEIYKCIETDRIYGQKFIEITGKNFYFLVDLFFIGNYYTMSHMIENIPDKINVNIHTFLARYFLSIDLFVEKTTSFDATAIRPNIRKYNPKDVNIDIITKTLQEWDMTYKIQST